MPDAAPSTPFAALAETLAGVAAASGRLDKADRLAAFLALLPNADLARAARWASGRIFPLADPRAVGVGTAAIIGATADATGAEADALRAALVRLGDAGDVAAEAVEAAGARPPSGWTLADAEAWFADLAATTGSKARTALVAGALRELAPHEARIAVRLLAGDLRIGMQEGGVESALARGFGVPLASVQRAHMLTGDLGEAAVRARAGTLGEARFRPFHAVRFMLATAAETSEARSLADEIGRRMTLPAIVEDKFDGIRAQVHLAPETDHAAGEAPVHGVVAETPAGPVRVALFSRTLDPLAGAFPDLVAPLAAVAAAHPALAAGGLVLDGEVVPLGPDGRIAPFQSLQTRLGRRAPSADVVDASPVAFVAYDVLVAGGEALLDRPLTDRLDALGALGLPSSRSVPLAAVARSHADAVDDLATLDERFDAARARGNEGLMVKDPASPYTPGRRGRDWRKVKKALATLDVVVTAVERGSGKRRHLLSDVTFAVRASPDDPTLLNVGKAYSGLTDAELAELTDWFEAHTLQSFAHGRVRTVEPAVVLEVAFDVVQPSARHKSGFALRFPRIVRLRPDKGVDDIDTLAAVAALAAPAG